MRRRLVPEGPVSIFVLLWGALGLIAGGAVGAFVHLETRPPVIFHGSYSRFDGGGTSAYRSTLTITYSVRHPELALLAGLAIGLLAGLVFGLIISSIRSYPVRSRS